MPPHGGHGGGGHHGGGGGHHGGGGHGGRRGGGFGPGIVWGAPWYGNDGYSEIVVNQCPGELDPVLATDGRVYNNPCEAQLAGVAVVRRVAPGKLSGLGGFSRLPDVAILGLFVGGLYLLLRPKRR